MSFAVSSRTSLLLTLLLLGGCASTGGKKKTDETRPVAARVIGTVSLVNEGFGFVLIDAHEYPAPGSLLKTFSPTAKTGELKVSRERRHPFLIGDVVKGSPGTGDVVLYQPEPASSSPASTPTTPPAPGPAQPADSSVPQYIPGPDSLPPL